MVMLYICHMGLKDPIKFINVEKNVVSNLRDEDPKLISLVLYFTWVTRFNC